MVSSSDACVSSGLHLLEPFRSILSPGRSSFRCFPNLPTTNRADQWEAAENSNIDQNPIREFVYFPLRRKWVMDVILSRLDQT